MVLQIGRTRTAILVLACITGLPLSAHAATCRPASAGVADIRTCIASASSGDTIDIHGYTATWNTSDCTGGYCIKLNKALKLIGDAAYSGGTSCYTSLTCGAGTLTTTITDATIRNGTIIPILIQYTASDSNYPEVAGIDFEDSTAAQDGFNGLITSDVTDSGSFKPTTIVFNNYFHNIQRRTVMYEGSPLPRVLVTHNTTNGATDSMVSPDNYSTPWASATVYGSANAVFLENNLYQFSTYTDYIIDCQYGGVYAARFNVVQFSGSEIGSAFGNHGYDSVYRGCQAQEAYNNTGTSSVSGGFYFVNSRGGTTLAFNNTWTGTWASGIGITNYRSFPDYTNSVGYCSNLSTSPSPTGCYSDSTCGGGVGTCVQGGSNLCGGSTPVDGNTSGSHGYACLDQIGRGGNQALDPDYEWLNTADFALYNGGGSNNTNQNTFHVLQNRDFYNYTSSFTGATGVGSGNRSSRPGTCTAGVAYWSVDQGTWNLSGVGGQGVLDKCTATNTWTNGVYVPYTYPHPLSPIQPPSTTTTVSVSGKVTLSGKVVF